MLRFPSPEGLSADAWRLRDGSAAVIRPATAADADAIQALVRSLSPQTRYQRFFNGVRELSPQWLARFTHAQPRGDVSLLASIAGEDRETLVGMAQYSADPFPERCDFALLVADPWQGKGLGKRLLHNLECIARAAGIHAIEGEVLAHNSVMLGLVRALGYRARRHPESALTLHVARPLAEPAAECSPLAQLAKGDFRRNLALA